MKEWQDETLVLNQPAGHIENNESAIEAVTRETAEESGWHIEPTGLLGMYSFTPFEGADTYHRLCFLCEAIEPTHQALDSDIVSSHWLTYEEVMKLSHRSPLIKACIEDSLRNPIIPLSFLSDQFLHPVSP